MSGDDLGDLHLFSYGTLRQWREVQLATFWARSLDGEDELAATDAYEDEAYSRAEVELESGRRAWAYVGPPR